jgi:hypothetical protein
MICISRKNPDRFENPAIFEGKKHPMSINAEWHRKHRMPKNPSLAERIKWHKAHAKHCGCRPVPASLKGKFKK